MMIADKLPFIYINGKIHKGLLCVSLPALDTPSVFGCMFYSLWGLWNLTNASRRRTTGSWWLNSLLPSIATSRGVWVSFFSKSVTSGKLPKENLPFP